jgi:hypothetical protein
MSESINHQQEQQHQKTIREVHVYIDRKLNVHRVQKLTANQVELTQNQAVQAAEEPIRVRLGQAHQVSLTADLRQVAAEAQAVIRDQVPRHQDQAEPDHHRAAEVRQVKVLRAREEDKIIEIR